MKKLFYILCGLLVICSYKSYSQENIQKDINIDPIAPLPYKIEYKSIVALPDSLGGNKLKGMASIECRINSNLKIEDIKIMKLLLFTREGNIVINYYYGKDRLSSGYPPEVRIYLPFFKDFVKRVKVKKQEGVSVKNMNQVVLMLRFN